jgi:hypothetical protein
MKGYDPQRGGYSSAFWRTRTCSGRGRKRRISWRRLGRRCFIGRGRQRTNSRYWKCRWFAQFRLGWRRHRRCQWCAPGPSNAGGLNNSGAMIRVAREILPSCLMLPAQTRQARQTPRGPARPPLERPATELDASTDRYTWPFNVTFVREMQSRAGEDSPTS